MDAGILSVRPDGKLTSHVERTLAMLSLTAFHDVMKVECLLPCVATEHAPFAGFRAGDVINDHDIALGYVLAHHGACVPSFDALPLAQQKTIRFTQGKMQFNHGWLVQAEVRAYECCPSRFRVPRTSNIHTSHSHFNHPCPQAPPKALFGAFKEVIMSGGAAGSDVAFYFVHWLTDLSGAVPSPLGGAEKFVLKFPHPVSPPCGSSPTPLLLLLLLLLLRPPHSDRCFVGLP